MVSNVKQIVSAKESILDKGPAFKKKKLSILANVLVVVNQPTSTHKDEFCEGQDESMSLKTFMDRVKQKNEIQRLKEKNQDTEVLDDLIKSQNSILTMRNEELSKEVEELKEKMKSG